MNRLVLVGLLVFAIACAGDDASSPYGDPIRPGDPGGGGGDAAGDPLAGDPLAGDPLAGDPLAGDPLAGDPLAGDPLAGDPLAGDPAEGDPAAGDPLAGDPGAGDPGAGDPYTDACTAGGDPVGCLPPDECIAGGCVPPVPDPAAYVAAAQTRLASYWWTLQSPATFEPAEPCCFDYTGDGRPDDTFGALLGLMGSIPGGSADPNHVINEAMQTGELVRVMDWRVLPPTLADGQVRMSLFEGFLNGDGSGGVVDAAGRRLGLSHVVLDAASFGSYGALSQFNRGDITTAVIGVSGGTVTLPTEFFLVPIELELQNVRLQAPVVLDSGGCHGVCTLDEVRADHVPALVAGGQLGGVVPMSQVLAKMDVAVRACAPCDPGISADQPVIAYAEDEDLGTLDISCCDAAHASFAQCTGVNAPAATNTCGPEHGSVCGSARTICSLLGVLGAVLDVDLDSDDINDAFSAGFRVGFSGTTIDGIAGQSCGASQCDGAELCETDVCECGGGAACDDSASICFDRGAGIGCQCIDGAAGDALCGGAPFACIDMECVNTDEDERYCGSARAACALGEGCASGVCLCGADFIDGTGGEVCDPSDRCIEDAPGAYRCECSGVLDGSYCGGYGNCCGGVCTELFVETDCGACGNTCTQTEGCDGDACTCTDINDCTEIRGTNVQCCTNGCRDTDRDIHACGDCSTDCDNLAPDGMVANRCDGSCVFRCEDGFFDCNDSLADGCETDLWGASSIFACGACTGGGCLLRVSEGESIQTALDAAPDGALVIVEEGSYQEDLAITKSVMLVTQGIFNVSLEGINTVAASSFPAVAANIDVSANDVLIQGFDFYGPAVTCDQYASGIVVSGSNVEIARNNFQVPTGAVSQAIQTLAAADVSGLSIHDNYFFHLTPLADNATCDPDAPNLYEAVMLNAQAGGTTVQIERNRFAGRLMRAVWTERAEVLVRDNDIESSAYDPFVGQGGEGLFPVGVHVGAANVTVERNAIQHLTRGVAVDVDLGANDDVVLSGNCIDGTQIAAAYAGTAGSFTVDATGNYWGPNGALACPELNCYDEPEVEVSGALTTCPVEVETWVTWSPL